MAVVKIDQIKTTLAKAMQYICNPDKTRDMSLVSTNLDVEAKDPLEYAKRFLDEQHDIGTGRNGRGDMVLAHHIIQSFDPGDQITPERAHELGVEFINELTDSDQYYVIATHMDKDHIHNHILLNPIVISQRKRMRMPRTMLHRMRMISDRLCRENGLKVIQPRVDHEKHYGKSRPDLYTQLKGESIKERIRTLVDDYTRSSTSMRDLQEQLGGEGIRLSIRGKYVLYTDLQSGLKFRDSRIGQGYGERFLMTKIGQENMECISFNKTLIQHEAKQTITVFVPGTRRKLAITIPRSSLVIDGVTYRAWLPRDSNQTLTHKDGTFAHQIPTQGLYDYFTPPRLDLNQLARTGMPEITGGSPAQRRRLMAQAYKVEQVNQVVRKISTTREYLIDGGMSSSQAVAAISKNIRDSQDTLQALIVASMEPEQTPEQTAALNQQIHQVETRISTLAKQARSLQPEPEHRQQRPTHRHVL